MRGGPDALGKPHACQELKSAQPELPAAVAEALRAAGWADADGAEADRRTCTRNNHRIEKVVAPADSRGGSSDFDVPGLTITSFHLAQLRRSLQARSFLLPLQCLLRGEFAQHKLRHSSRC